MRISSGAAKSGDQLRQGYDEERVGAHLNSEPNALMPIPKRL
jgi:hypothetical protein